MESLITFKDQCSPSPGRSVTFSTSKVRSTAILKAISHAAPIGMTKSKAPRGQSRSVLKAQPQLVFEYGPTSYRGLVAHRKVKLIPFAEHFQRKYPDFRVYYKPSTEYNMVCVKLKDTIVHRGLLSNVPYPNAGNLTSLKFYKTINDAIQRMLKYPNLLVMPFKDPICLMTHNLDVDYDGPWYRTQFPQRNKHKNSIVAHCRIEWDDESNYMWEKYKKKIENSPGFEDLLNEGSSAPLNQFEGHDDHLP